MIILMILIIGTTTGYDLQCPARSEWSSRANVSCFSEDKYVCLLNILEKKYEENCLGSDKSSIGSKLVFQPLFNLAECNSERYQPVVFTTYGNSECILIKSKCDEEGQVVYSNGSNSDDVTCRCDFTKGYAFIKRPKNSCFCKPSEEDCSCHRSTCTQLSPDYQCITGGAMMVNTKCWELHPHLSSDTRNSTDQFIESNRKSVSNVNLVAPLIMVTIVCIAVTVLKVFVCVPPTVSVYEIVNDDGTGNTLIFSARSILPIKFITFIEEPEYSWGSYREEFGGCNWICYITRAYTTPFENVHAAYTFKAANMIGTTESDPIHLNEDKSQNFIHERMLKGECGKLHFARLVFIGKHGVGKTSLMRRLLWQNKEDLTATQSTDGIEVEKCNINITNGKWSRCNGISDELTRIMHTVYKGIVETEQRAPRKDNSHQEQFGSKKDETNSISDDTKISHSSDDIDNIKNFSEVTDRESSEKDTSLVSENIIHDAKSERTVIYERQPQNNKFQNVSVNSKLSFDRESDSGKDPDKNINQLTRAIIKSHFQQRETEQDDMLAFCWLWDFAGQKDFYATHQVFLSNCAVYVLVTDSSDFTTADDKGIDIGDSAKYVNFWFDVIHCYWSTTTKGRLDPPINVVCTNEDKYKEEPVERLKRRDKFEEKLGKVLKHQEKKRHFRNLYFVSNLEDDDNVFEKIRDDISRQAMGMKDWGKECPLKWLLFQQVLENLREGGVPISTTTKLSKIAQHDAIGIDNDEQFKLCLQYCHDNGTVIYFEEENLKDYVILDPKWLVDAFRCLVSDKIEKDIKVSDDWQKLTETGELTDTLVSDLFKKEPKLRFFENKSHLLEVMKRFDIIINLKNSTALYMPCMMKSCTFEEVRHEFISESQSFIKTSWLCLDFEFLPPAFFNHILAWCIKRFVVSVILEKGICYERKALYRQIGVFDLDLSGCEQFVVCEGPNVIAVQVWNSQISDKTYEHFRKTLCEFVDTLRNRYRLKIKFTTSFKCKDGDFTINRKKLNVLLTTNEYRCLEHKTNHISEDLIQPWYVGDEIRMLKEMLKEEQEQFRKDNENRTYN